MSRKRSEEMFPIVEAYMLGDEKVEVICDRHGLTRGQFYYWHRKYEASKEDLEASGNFVPIEIIESTNSYTIEIQTPGGTTLRSNSLIPVSYVGALIERGC